MMAEAAAVRTESADERDRTVKERKSVKGKTGAVILAAGDSDIAKTEMVKQELDTLREAGISPVVIVTGRGEEKLKKELVHRKVIFVENPRAKTTKMFASIRLGLDVLEGTCMKALIVNVDTPSFALETIQALTESDYELAFPVHEGRPGHPFCVSMDALGKIRSYKGQGGIQGMIRKNLLSAALVEVRDPGIHMEAKEEASLREVLRYQKDALLAQPICAKVSFSLGRPDSFFDEDLAALLRRIGEGHSMNGACKDLGMAYSRGWKMLKKAEEMLGYDLVSKQVGGSSGGGTVLTEKGESLVSDYEDLRRKIIAFAKEGTARIFQEKD